MSVGGAEYARDSRIGLSNYNIIIMYSGILSTTTSVCACACVRIHHCEKEGSLCEVEVPPCWYSLSHSRPT